MAARCHECTDRLRCRNANALRERRRCLEASAEDLGLLSARRRHKDALPFEPDERRRGGANRLGRKQTRIRERSRAGKIREEAKTQILGEKRPIAPALEAKRKKLVRRGGSISVRLPRRLPQNRLCNAMLREKRDLRRKGLGRRVENEASEARLARRRPSRKAPPRGNQQAAPHCLLPRLRIPVFVATWKRFLAPFARNSRFPGCTFRVTAAGKAPRARHRP